MTTTTEPRAAERWAVDRVAADATLVSLLAGGQAWMKVPREIDTALKPALVFGFQSTRPPSGAITSAPRSWSEWTVILRARVIQRTFSRNQIEPVEARLLDLFDGHFSEPLVADNGQLWHSRLVVQLPDIEQELDDQVQIITATTWFEVSLKVGA